MKNTIKLLLLVFITVINSCGNEDENSIVNHVANKKPKTIEYENRIICSFSYTNDNKLSQIINYYNNDIVTYDISYSGNELTDCVYNKYTADPDAGFVNTKFEKVTRNKILATIISPEQTNSIYAIILNDKGLPIKINLEDGISVENDYEFFYYPNSSIIHQIRRSNKYSTSTYTYEYDNKSGMMCNINTPIWFIMFHQEIISVEFVNNFMSYINNCVKVTEVSRGSSGSSYTDIVYDLQYTYDNDNFPISIVDPLRDDFFTINY